MAQKKRQTAKRSAIKRGRLAKWLGHDSKALIFVILFAVVGVIMLYRSFAVSDYPTDASSIVAAYKRESPSKLTRSTKTGPITYTTYSASYLVLGDGSLQCDNGNSLGVVTVGKISQTDLAALHTALVNLNLSTVAKKSPANAKVDLNSLETYILADKGVNYGWTVYTGGTKDTKLAQMQSKIQSICQLKATTSTTRSKLTRITIPKLSQAHSPSLIQHVATKVSPKADALPASNGSTIDTATADDQVNKTNYVRGLNGLPALTRQNCLNNVAYAQAQAMAGSTTLYHDPSLADDVDRECGGWILVGENVGDAGNSNDLFDAYINSPGHLRNILESRYIYVGSGAYKTPDGRIYHAEEFAQE
ncbi:MAG TPA: CAP domain-containing protein [Candidatus Saccharimonadales bacterium]|nr:CAP domain-containing protein [Candidatus Saccharimonadales bacterium]